MGSRDQIYGSVSSLVVRPSDSGGSGHGNDYEPGEIRRDEPPRHGSSSYYERSDRFAHSGMIRLEETGNLVVSGLSSAASQMALAVGELLYVNKTAVEWPGTSQWVLSAILNLMNQVEWYGRRWLPSGLLRFLS